MQETNENQAIKTAVGVLMTLALVGIIITLFVKVIPLIENANKKVDVVNEQMETIYFKNYDGSEVAGSEVISAINTKASNDIKITVVTLAGSTVEYNKASYNITSVNNKSYIEPSGKFEATLQRNSNKSVTGITFTQK